MLACVKIICGEIIFDASIFSKHLKRRSHIVLTSNRVYTIFPQCKFLRTYIMRFFANHAARMIAMRKRTRYISYNALEGANHMILYDLLRFSHISIIFHIIRIKNRL